MYAGAFYLRGKQDITCHALSDAAEPHPTLRTADSEHSNGCAGCRQPRLIGKSHCRVYIGRSPRLDGARTWPRSLDR
jgi:hypothetical protein